MLARHQLTPIFIFNPSCNVSVIQQTLYSFIHFRYLYSASSRFLLRGAPDSSADTESEFHAEAHEQLRVKDLPRVPTRRLEVDSNPQPSGCKAPNIPLHHHAPHYISSCIRPLSVLPYINVFFICFFLSVRVSLRLPCH